MKIYALINPENKQIRYIGQTIQPLSRRLNRHICESKKLLNRKDYWIRSLLLKGVRPEIKLIFNACCRECLDRSEKYFIKRYNSLNCNLVNLQSGGRSNNVLLSDKTRKQMSDKRKAFWSNDNNRKNILIKQKEGKIKDKERLREINSHLAKTHLQSASVRAKATASIKLSLNSEKYKNERRVLTKNYWNKLDINEKKAKTDNLTVLGRKKLAELKYYKSEKNLAHIKQIAQQLRIKKAKPFIGFKDKKKVGSWTNLIDAERQLGIAYQNIYAVLKGKAKSAKGYVFEYFNDELKYFHE